MKKHFNKEIIMTKEGDNNLETLQNVEFVIILLLKVMLNEEIIVMSLEIIDVPHTETVISTSV